MTDDSGGHRDDLLGAQDLDPATAGIASELSQQYFLEVLVLRSEGRQVAHHRGASEEGSCLVRARRGFYLQLAFFGGPGLWPRTIRPG